MTTKKGDVTVMMYAYTEDNNGHQDYYDGDEPSGWCVYIREETPEDEQQPFDTFSEQDFKSREGARYHAMRMARLLNCEIMEY